MPTREQELADAGWKKKTTTDEPRLSELVRAYRRIGCDVHLEPFDPAGQSGCRCCNQAATKSCKTIYIRPAGRGVDD